jgi:hypothetical protein
MGMGGDKLVAAVAGREEERRLGDRLRERWELLDNELIDEVEPFAGGFSAAELLDAGAIGVCESLEELRGALDETPLGPGSAAREPGPVSG